MEKVQKHRSGFWTVYVSNKIIKHNIIVNILVIACNMMCLTGKYGTQSWSFCVFFFSFLIHV